jgi:VWFA-related protein
MSRQSVLLVAVFATVSTTLGVETQEQLPRFKGGVNVIQLDASVLDRDGHPLRGLTADDFTILEDGRPQRIVAFSEVVLPAYTGPPVGWIRDVAPDIRHNQLPDGRLLVIVIDDGMLPPDPYMVKQTKQIATGIIDRMGPADLASIVFTRDGRNAQDFTADRARLLKAIDRTAAGFIFSVPNDPMARDTDVLWYDASVETLRMVAEALRTVPNRRKTIAYISIGGPADPESTAPRLIAPGQSMGDVNALRDLRENMRDMYQGTLGSQTTIYAFDPSGLDGLESYKAARPGVKIPPPQLFHESLRELANNTGGRATLETNDWSGGLERMFRETSAYYLLGYETANPAPDGKFRRLEINVNRPGAQVRTRSGYWAPKPEKGPRAQPAAAAAAAIGRVLPRSDLPMQAMAAPFAGSGNKAAVLIVAGLRHPVSAGASAEDVDMLVSAFDPEGRPKGSQRQNVRLQLRQVALGEARYEILTRLDLDPGRYNLRLGAHSSLASDTGSVYLDVEVPDFSKEGLSTSGLLLTSTAAPIAAPPNALAGLVPVIPTTLRQFARSDRVSGFLRVYQGGRKPLVPVSVTTRIVDERATTMSQRRIEIGVDQFRSRAADVPFDVPVASLAPGPYLLDVDIEATGSARQRQTRHVRFQVGS